MPSILSVFSPSRSFVHHHLLLSLLVCSASSASLGPMTHFPSHPRILGRHLSSLVFAEDRCQMRKLFEQLLKKSWPGIALAGGFMPTAQKLPVLHSLRSRAVFLLSSCFELALETRIHFLPLTHLFVGNLQKDEEMKISQIKKKKRRVKQMEIR